MGHNHPVIDADPHFKIDKTTRAITDASGKQSVLMQGDHNSERYTFEIPRYIDGHDMSLCDLVEIHYVNTDSNKRTENKGIYIVDDLQVSETQPDEVVQFTWLISNAVTVNAGPLSFLIRFSCTEGGKTIYAWNTGINKDKSISLSMYNADTIQQEHPDLIAHIEEAIKGKVDSKNRAANKFLGTDGTGKVIDKDIDYSEVKNAPKIPTKISELEDDSNFVKAEEGKGLSSNDFTNEYKKKIDDLSYVKIAFVSASINKATNEIGSTVTDVDVNWKLNKTPKTLKAQFGSEAQETLTNSETSKSYSGKTVKSNTNIILTASDERNTVVTKQLTIAFLPKAYWGLVDNKETYTTEDILALSNSVLTGSRQRTLSMNATSGKHILYAIPSSFGTPTFNVGGFDGGFVKVGTVSHRNASGHTQNYDVWKSVNAGLGSVNVLVK